MIIFMKGPIVMSKIIRIPRNQKANLSRLPAVKLEIIVMIGILKITTVVRYRRVSLISRMMILTLIHTIESLMSKGLQKYLIIWS